jgi:hypothetical protein
MLRHWPCILQVHFPFAGPGENGVQEPQSTPTLDIMPEAAASSTGILGLSSQGERARRVSRANRLLRVSENRDDAIIRQGNSFFLREYGTYESINILATQDKLGYQTCHEQESGMRA